MQIVRHGRGMGPRESAPLRRSGGRRAALGLLLSFALPLILVLAGCASLASSVAPFDASELSRNPTLIVATTRKPVAGARAKPWFGTERAPAMTFARAKLVPPDDGRFSLSAIGLGDWSLEAVEPVARLSELSDLLPPGQEPRDVLLYVHGFNTTFETAALDAARLSDGIRFRGQTMLFSWPSKAKLFDYGYDRESAMWSRDELERVLSLLMASPGVGRIHVVAHSVGTMLSMESLRQIYDRHGIAITDKIGAVIFASPDIDMDVFTSSVQRIPPLVPKITSDHGYERSGTRSSRMDCGGDDPGRGCGKIAARKGRVARHRCIGGGVGAHQPRPLPVERADSAGDSPRRGRAAAGSFLNCQATGTQGRGLRCCPPVKPHSLSCARERHVTDTQQRASDSTASDAQRHFHRRSASADWFLWAEG